MPTKRKPAGSGSKKGGASVTDVKKAAIPATPVIPASPEVTDAPVEEPIVVAPEAPEPAAPKVEPAPAKVAAKPATKSASQIGKASVPGAVDEKLARIRGLKNHECQIGRVRYYIKEGEAQSVPESVAMILGNARIVVKL